MAVDVDIRGTTAAHRLLAGVSETDTAAALSAVRAATATVEPGGDRPERWWVLPAVAAAVVLVATGALIALDRGSGTIVTTDQPPSVVPGPTTVGEVPVTTAAPAPSTTAAPVTTVAPTTTTPTTTTDHHDHADDDPGRGHAIPSCRRVGCRPGSCVGRDRRPAGQVRGRWVDLGRRRPRRR